MGRDGFMSGAVKKILVVLFVFALMAGFASVPAFASEDAKVKESFELFQKEWIQKLRTHGKYGEQHAQVAADSNAPGMFVAEYEALTEPTSFEVKKTDVKATPYVGIVQYEKLTYSSRAKTPEEAKLGPYQVTSSSEITEIFRFSNGKWVY